MQLRRLVPLLIAAVVVATIAGGGYLGYEFQQRRVALAVLSSSLKQATVRLEESFAIESAPSMTYKELFERMQRYVAAADDKMLELRAMDVHRVELEAGFVAAYLTAASNLWRSKAGLYQAFLGMDHSTKWADERMRELASNSGSRAYLVVPAYKSVSDAQDAVDKFGQAQRDYLTAIGVVESAFQAVPAGVSLTDLVKPETLAAGRKAVDKSMPEMATRELAIYRQSPYFRVR